MNKIPVLRPWLASLNAHRSRIILGFCLMFMTAIAGITLLGLSGWFISAAAIFVVAFDIFVPGGAIRALALLRTVSRYVERVYNHDLILRLQQRWRVKLFQGLVRQPLLVSEKFRLAHVLQRLTQDLNALDDLYIRVLAPFALVSLSGGVLGLGFALLNPYLAYTIWGLTAVLLCLHGFVLAPQLRTMAARELQASEGLRQASLTFVESKAELHAWQVLPQALSHVSHHRMSLQRQQRVLRKRLNVLQAVVELWSLLSAVTVLAIALEFALSGAFSIPLAIFCGLAVLAMLEQWLLLGQASLLWGRVVGAAERLQPMLADSQSSSVGEVHQAQKPPALRLQHVEVGGRTLPGRFSLDLRAGQITLLSGASGAGKTTLLMFLAGALPKRSGEFSLNQQQVAESTLALDAAVLTQHNAVLSQSVAANLRMGHHEYTDEMLWCMLERVEMADTIEQLPAQLDTWLGDGGVQLSGGQQRRLALARTLLFAQQRQLVLLDEPFNGVGASQAARIWQQLRPLLKSKTVLIVSHQQKPFVKDTDADPVVQLPIELCYNCAP